MNSSRILFSVLFACSTMTAVACDDGSERAFEAAEGDAPLEPAGRARTQEEPPCGANGMLPACFWAPGSQQALRTLGGAALQQGGNTMPAIPASQVQAECRHVLKYAVQCALPQGQALTDPVTGEEYPGWWGLAPGWKDAALDAAGRRYVTACLLQRLNATGTQVPIALEGPSPAIEQDAEVAAIFSIEESTAFGDLFSSERPLDGLLPAFDAYVCSEDLLSDSCGLLGLPLLEERICDDTGILCGLVPLGPCWLACAANGPYYKCKPGLLSPCWTETVRVRLDPETCQ